MLHRRFTLNIKVKHMFSIIIHIPLAVYMLGYRLDLGVHYNFSEVNDQNEKNSHILTLTFYLEYQGHTYY